MIYRAAKLFTGTEWLDDQLVITEDGRITGIVDAKDMSQAYTSAHHIIAPALIDIQIYGAYGKLLSVYPDTDSLYKLYDYCKAGGASHFQPTVATNTYEVFFAAIDAVKNYWAEGGKGCIGLHVEGPWIHPSKKGAHIESFIHSPSVDDVKRLLDYAQGAVTMITLAPEMCNKEVIELIQSYGVIISAGHTNADYEEATRAFDNGIHAATHLYNAMSPLQHRAPGMVGAILDHDVVMSSLVPDGYHVDFAAIRVAKKIMADRLFVITDAVTDTDKGPYQHYLNGDKYEAAGILSGSALTMIKCVHNLVNHAGISTGEALRMASLYPAQVMRKDDYMGKIETGYEANLLMLDEKLEIEKLVTH